MPSFHPGAMPFHRSPRSVKTDGKHSQTRGYGYEQPPAAPAWRHVPGQDMGPVQPDPFDQYKSAAAPTMYDHMAQYNYGAPAMPHGIGAPTLPPLHMNEQYLNEQRLHQMQANAMSSAVEFQRRQAQDYNGYKQQAKEEKSVGGVSAKLDYEMDQMVDFVSEMTIGIIKPGVPYPADFRKWVMQVLNATRLPSATIVQSLSYLTLRVRGLVAAGIFVPTDRTLYEMLTVALILGSKFLDDNTFQNKSWAEVSNITVKELNAEERRWLASFEHRLHHDPACADGFNVWQDQWRSYRANAMAASSTLHPIDTSSLRHQRSAYKNMSQSPYPRQHPTSAKSGFPQDGEVADPQYAGFSYSPYNPWSSHRSSIEKSPASAPYTGPPTPEYYASHAGWGPSPGCASRPSYYNYPQFPQYNATGISSYSSTYNTPSYQYINNGFWNCHGAGCQCANCRQVQILQPRNGPIVVG